MSFHSESEASLPPSADEDTGWLAEVLRLGPESTPLAVIDGHAVVCEHSTHLAGLLANTCALVRLWLPDLVWVGVYVTARAGQPLLLGSCQGPPAPERVGWGVGIVGSAAMDRAVQIVGEARRLPRASRVHPQASSVLAVPVIRDGATVCVLGLEAATNERFGLVEVETMGAMAVQLERHWPGGAIAARPAD